MAQTQRFERESVLYTNNRIGSFSSSVQRVLNVISFPTATVVGTTHEFTISGGLFDPGGGGGSSPSSLDTIIKLSNLQLLKLPATSITSSKGL